MQKFSFLLLFFAFIQLNGQSIDVTLQELNFGGDGNPREMVRLGDSFIFIGDNGDVGDELWISDGTILGTQLIKDINPGFRSSVDGTDLEADAILNNILYFAADDNVHGYELWRTDGSEAGTYMVKNVNPNESQSGNPIRDIFEINGKLVFTHTTPATGTEIWVSDGTEAGTVLLLDINPSTSESFPLGFFRFQNHIYFAANDGSNGSEMWRTDGTSVGTELFLDIYPGAFDGFSGGALTADSKFYFAGNDGTLGTELWVSDGTVANTNLVKDMAPGSSSSIGIVSGVPLSGDTILFNGYSPTSGRDLWISDGTDSGTLLLKDIDNQFGTSVGQDFIMYNGEVYFSADDTGNGFGELWKSDGTENGTIKVLNPNTGNSYETPTNFYVGNQKLLFGAIDDSSNHRLFNYDSSNNQSEVLNENATFDLFQDYGYVELDGFIYFVLDEPIHEKELWKTLGTASTTSFFTDVNSSDSGVSSENVQYEINDLFIFTGGTSISGAEPFVYDTETNEFRIINDVNDTGINASSMNDRPEFTQIGNEIFFFARTDAEGVELHKTSIDGTGSNLIKDILPGTSSSIGEFSFLINFNNIAYFVATDGVNGYELWRSDGTDSGTFMVIDLSPNQNSIGSEAVVFNNKLYFIATDTAGGGAKIFRTDGTENGTVLVSGGKQNTMLRTDGNRLYFARNSTSDNCGARFLFSIDTNENMGQITEFMGGCSFSLRYGVVNNGDLYCAAPSPSSSLLSLIKSNGEPNNVEVLYSVPTGGNYRIRTIFNCGDYIYFVVDQGGLPVEVWRTDGTLNGTILLEEYTSADPFIFDKFSCQDNRVYYLRDFFDRSIWSTNGNLSSKTEHPINFGPTDLFDYILDIQTTENNLFVKVFSEVYGIEYYVGDVSEILSTIDVSSSTNSSHRDFYVYPNPTNGITTIESLKLDIDRIAIFDLAGKLVFEHSKKEIGRELSFNLSQLNSGFYILNVHGNGDSVNLKLIKH